LFNILEHKYLISLEVKEEEGIKHGREKSFDELIGTHVALAFVHFEGFTLESVLFKSLWDKADSDKQKEFILLSDDTLHIKTISGEMTIGLMSKK
jgi:hypothetical protein